jgi:hypothetical protein
LSFLSANILPLFSFKILIILPLASILTSKVKVARVMALIDLHECQSVLFGGLNTRLDFKTLLKGVKVKFCCISHVLNLIKVLKVTNPSFATRSTAIKL